MEHESSKGEAGSRREQQHPCNPSMCYYFSPSRDWKGDLSGALEERTTSNVHPLAVKAEAQFALPLFNLMIHDLCLLLVKLSALRCLRDDCLYFKSANRILIKTIFVFSLDFMLTLKTYLFYLEKYKFRQLKLVIHPY